MKFFKKDPPPPTEDPYVPEVEEIGPNSRLQNIAAAMSAIGYTETPADHVWHFADAGHMELVPRGLHRLPHDCGWKRA